MTPEWVADTSQASLHRMLTHAEVVGLSNTDESTFRSFFMAELRIRYPKVDLETEWRRFDLIARINLEVCLIEFKYFLHRRGSTLAGVPANWKGGAGSQNEREFWACVNKLASFEGASVAARIVVLVYERLAEDSSRKCFHSSYGSLTTNSLIASVDSIERPQLMCKILTIAPEGTPDSQR